VQVEQEEKEGPWGGTPACQRRSLKVEPGPEAEQSVNKSRADQKDHAKQSVRMYRTRLSSKKEAGLSKGSKPGAKGKNSKVGVGASVNGKRKKSRQ